MVDITIATEALGLNGCHGWFIHFLAGKQTLMDSLDSCPLFFTWSNGAAISAAI
jgi:hypothetical protein